MRWTQETLIKTNPSTKCVKKECTKTTSCHLQVKLRLSDAPPHMQRPPTHTHSASPLSNGVAAVETQSHASHSTLVLPPCLHRSLSRRVPHATVPRPTTPPQPPQCPHQLPASSFPTCVTCIRV